MERGGNLILVRCPSSGWIKGGEDKFLSREEFWEPLVNASKAKAYYFEDYDQFKNLICPEDSHLSAKDARFFTTELVRIMKADGALSNSKTNHVIQLIKLHSVFGYSFSTLLFKTI